MNKGKIRHFVFPSEEVKLVIVCNPRSEDRKSAVIALGIPREGEGGVRHIEEETDRREGKGRCCCLGDVLECRTNHLAARMI